MAWVTKSSTEEYNQTPEPPKQYTRREKAGNWWHYNRIVVIIVVVVLAILASILYDMFGRPEPDYTIGWVGDIDLPEDTAQALTDQLTAICDDRNGDGQVLVELAQFPYNFRGESTADASYQMAVITRLDGDLGTDDGCYIFLLQDPEGFENHTQVLQYLDGTLPAEDCRGLAEHGLPLVRLPGAGRAGPGRLHRRDHHGRRVRQQPGLSGQRLHCPAGQPPGRRQRLLQRLRRAVADTDRGRRAAVR